VTFNFFVCFLILLISLNPIGHIAMGLIHVCGALLTQSRHSQFSSGPRENLYLLINIILLSIHSLKHMYYNQQYTTHHTRVKRSPQRRALFTYATLNGEDHRMPSEATGDAEQRGQSAEENHEDAEAHRRIAEESRQHAEHERQRLAAQARSNSSRRRFAKQRSTSKGQRKRCENSRKPSAR
jgi:hypothetical protein